MSEARIGRYANESTPSFATPVRPPAGAPNVVVIVLDDLGFAQLGCFGSDIATPNIDSLAAEGVRYNRFHVTSLCSPTRACLMTGRNHHRVGMGFLTDVPLGYPGYTARIPSDVPTLPGVLRDAGYNAFAVGKWHLAPRFEQSAAGPFDRWPLGLGFERYYGFVGPDTNQWTPKLAQDNSFVDPPRRPEDGYHLTEDLADRAIGMILDQKHAAPDKPFFLYFATGAMHAPHHAPAEWIDRYAGHFDGGWEQWRRATFERQVAAGVVPANTTLLDRPSWVQDWNALGADERRLYARMMEVFAGFLSHTDAQIGRLIDFLRRIDALDNTMVLLFSDNGTSAEGGPSGSINELLFTHDRVDDIGDLLAHIDDLGGFRAYNHYPWGWAWAGNTPLRLWKRYSWLGGVRTPLIARGPGVAGDAGSIDDEFCHVTDLLPTICDAAGIDIPAGVDGAPIGEGHPLQYFEMLGSRSMYANGWKATTDHVGKQITIERQLVEGSKDFETDRWELFNLADDFAESHDLSAEQPEKVRELEALWWSEAGRNQVLPLDDSFVARIGALERSPVLPRFRSTYRPGGDFVAEDLIPGLGAGFDLIAEIAEAGDGIVAALGDWNSGWAIYILDGSPVVAFSLFNEITRVVSTTAMPAGSHELKLSYRSEGGAVSVLLDGEVVGEGALPGHLPFRWQIGGGGLLIGRDSGFPVCDDYTPPFTFTGTITAVHIEIPRLAPPPAAASEVAVALKRE
jgi:arylsulfatase